MIKKYIKKVLPEFLNIKIRNILKRKRIEKFKNNSTFLNKELLIEKFKDSGICKGDVLFIHSSLKGLGFIENGPNDIINALKELVGSEGTLVFPTFSMNSTMYLSLSSENYRFDPKTSISNVGAITNAFLNTSGIFRSIHPTHSVAAWGKYAEYITKDHYKLDNNFGEGSPFGKVLELNGKIVGLGVNYGPITFYHVYEDLNRDKFPGVYLENKFQTEIINYDGEIEKCFTWCHNPDFHKNRIDKNLEIEAFFANHLKNTISHESKIGDGRLWWVYSKDLIQELDNLFKRNITIYKIN